MAKKVQDRIKALEVALKNESTERDFYLQHAARTKNEFGKKMFMSIANDEAEHYDRIKALHKKLKDKGKWPERLALTVKGTKIQSVLAKLSKVAEKTAKADNNDLEAVKIAINFEKKGEKYYSDLKKSAADAKEKAFFEMLADMEREHRLSLESTRDYFKDPTGWFRIKERLHVDGG
jgi:rubrerythrin